MVPSAPKNYCVRCDTSIPMEVEHCPRCGDLAQPLQAQPPAAGEDDHGAWSDLRLTPEELAAAPNPTTRASIGDWGRGSKAPAKAPPATDPGATAGPPLQEATGSLAAEADAPAARVEEPPPSNKPADPELDDALDYESEEPLTTIRPPVLASDALQRELFPLEPGKIMVRWVATILGLIGGAGTLVLLGLSPGGVPISSGFAALTTLGMVPMAYLARAAALWLFSALGMFAANLIYYTGTHDSSPLALLTAVILLGQGLHFRAWHRSSRAARVLVGLGITGGIAWLSAVFAITDLTRLSGDWRQWAPVVMQIPLGLLLMLSLLAYMDARTTAGCGAWAAGVWVWYGAYLVLVAAAVSVPPETWTPAYASSANYTVAVVQLANGLLAPILGISTAQVMAGSLGVAHATRRRPAEFNYSQQPPPQTDMN